MYENREFFIDCDGINVHARLDLPKKQAEKMHVLIIIPGLTGHIEERHILAVKDTALGCGYAVLRAELYGHGKSDGAFREHTVLLWMNEAMRVIDYALSLPFCKDVIISGHSQGGLATVLAAGLMFDKVKAAMPMSPALNIWDGARKGELFGFTFDPEHIPAEAPAGTGVNGNYLRAAAMLPVEEAVARFKKPVLVIHGTADAAVPYPWGEWLNERYEDAKLVTIEGDDHCYNFHLEKVLKAVKEFLAAETEIPVR